MGTAWRHRWAVTDRGVLSHYRERQITIGESLPYHPEKIYSDAFTGTKAHRPELDKLLAVLQAGDKLVITKLDRIARSASQGKELVMEKSSLLMVLSYDTFSCLNFTISRFWCQYF